MAKKRRSGYKAPTSGPWGIFGNNRGKALKRSRQKSRTGSSYSHKAFGATPRNTKGSVRRFF